MTDTLTVATHFEDLSQFSTGFVDRVDEDRLILYGPTAYEDGQEIDFAILLLDGSPAIEGKASILATVDGGEARDPSARYDVYLQGLQLGGMAQAVFERTLLARSSMAGDAPQTGEIDAAGIEEMEAAAAESPVAEADDFGGESTVVAADPQALADAYEAERAAAAADATGEAADAGDWAEPVAEEAAADAGDWAEPVAEEAAADAGDWAEPVAEEAAADAGEWAEPVAEEAAADAGEWAEPVAEEAQDFAEVDAAELADESAFDASAGPDAGTGAALAGQPSAPPPAPEDPGGFALPRAEGALTRPSREPAWWPAPAEREGGREPSGYFAYEGELPLPAAPPRPELDPSYRVGPAPRPSTDHSSGDHASPDAADEEQALQASSEEPMAAAEFEGDFEGEIADGSSDEGETREVELAEVGDYGAGEEAPGVEADPEEAFEVEADEASDEMAEDDGAAGDGDELEDLEGVAGDDATRQVELPDEAMPEEDMPIEDVAIEDVAVEDVAVEDEIPIDG